jgi:hypothetical protein
MKIATAITIGLIMASAIVSTSANAAATWYFVNRHPAPSGVAAHIAEAGSPYGYYWLRANGDWGAEGDAAALGNIRGMKAAADDSDD